MAQTGYTPIQLYYSATPSATPSSVNLVNGELALNIADEKLYFKNASGTVKLLASNATSAPVLTFSGGTTGLTPNTPTNGAITLSGTLTTANGGTGLTAFTAGTAIYASSSSALVSGTLPTTGGGTGLTSFTSGGAVYATSTSALTTGTLPASAGGTGQSANFNQYGITYASTTTSLATTAAGTAGQVLTSNGTSAPTWQTPTGISTGKSIAMAMIFGF